MKSSLIHCLSLLLCGLSTSLLLAGPLPSLKETGWGSYHAGYQGSGMEIAVDVEGEIEFYFTPKKKLRMNRAWPIECNIRIERREKGKEKWVRKTTQRDGFTSAGDVEFGQDKIAYEATVTGGVKFKVDLQFDRNGVNIQSEMVGTPDDANEADYRLVLETAMPTILSGSSKYDEKELKSKTRGDEVRIEFKKEKEVKVRLYEETDIKKITAAFPTSIMLKADKIGRKKFTWSMLDSKDKGSLELEFKSNSKRFLNGFNIRTILTNEKGEPISKGIRLEYR